jgi:hypothetical protein
MFAPDTQCIYTLSLIHLSLVLSITTTCTSAKRPAGPSGIDKNGL